jgi:hypothetical protein
MPTVTFIAWLDKRFPIRELIESQLMGYYVREWAWPIDGSKAVIFRLPKPDYYNQAIED